MPKRQPTKISTARNRPRGIHEIIVRARAMPHVVYWLFDDTCIDPATDGYVGSTACLIVRLAGQMHNPALPISRAFKVKILFRGSKRACLAVEAQLRPASGIGWNAGPHAGRPRIRERLQKKRKPRRRLRHHPIKLSLRSWRYFLARKKRAFPEG